MAGASHEQDGFQGRVALITGAGKGLGRAYAHWLADRGAAVVVNNRTHPDTPSSAAAVAEAIRAKGRSAIADEHSVETQAGAAAMVEAARQAFGRLDILICNAGVAHVQPLEEMNEEDVRLIMDINLYGSLHPIRAALPLMYAAGYGRILATTSSSGLFPAAGSVVYSTTKAALVGLVRSLAAESVARGVQANLISPMAWSDMAASRLDAKYATLMAPEHVAKMAAWLVSEACPLNGKIIVAGLGMAFQAAVVQTPGVSTVDVDPECVWRQLDDLSQAHEVQAGMTTALNLLAAYDARQSAGS